MAGLGALKITQVFKNTSQQKKKADRQIKPSKPKRIPGVQLMKKGKVLHLRFLKPVINPIPHYEVLAELRKAELLGETRDGKQIYLYQSPKMTPLLRELGRLREIAFRAVGEGSGKSCDNDHHDFDYEHLVLWDPSDLEIAGAYRLVKTSQYLKTHNLSDLYTHSLFEYESNFLPILNEGLELGRSFVQPKYWGNRSLDYLWYGIGAYLKKHPDIRYLFGPVSISGQLPARAKALIVSFYQSHFMADKSLQVKSRAPYCIAKKYQKIAYFGHNYRDEFRQLKERLKAMKLSIPTLYKQYSEVCESGGVFFSSFNIDKDFGNCIDGLVVTDLHLLKPEKKRRYMDS